MMRLSDSIEQFIKELLNEDGSGTVVWDDGKVIPSSVKYVHQKDEHLHKAIARVLNLPEIEWQE